MQKFIWVLVLIGVVAGLKAQSHQHVVTTTVLNCQQPDKRSSLLDWGDGVTGSVDHGIGAAGSAGFGTGLPNEDQLDCVINGSSGYIGYWLTLTIDDSTPVELTICMDLSALGYDPGHLAYWNNVEWIYKELWWTDNCVTFTLDPTNVRIDVDIPIVFSNVDILNSCPVLWFDYVELNNICYEDGDQVEITMDIDTGLVSEILIETNLLDGNGVTIDSTSSHCTISGDEDDSFIEILTIPFGTPSPWFSLITVYYIGFISWQSVSWIEEIIDCTPVPSNTWIRHVEFDYPCYWCGQDMEITIEIDTELSEQELLVETNLFNAFGEDIGEASRTIAIVLLEDEPFTEIINIPCANPYSPSWTVQIIVYDANSYEEQDVQFYNLGDCCVPVTLSSFTAIYNNSPTLSWTTQSESNNLGWNIYRSLSENMGLANQINDLLIPGNGTTSEPTEYVYNDLSDVESNTTYWYWLESASYNGETELYGPVTLTIQDDENQLPELPTASVLHNNYPNPFNPSTMINFSINQEESGSLTIFNTKGQVMESHKYESGNHQFNWDATQYSSGIYFYKLETQNYTNIKKMIMVK